MAYVGMESWSVVVLGDDDVGKTALVIQVSTTKPVEKPITNLYTVCFRMFCW